MKHLMTLVALLVSTAAVAQIPTLPWNPDGNGDGVIGSSDLIGLLTVYGQEFQNAIVSENQESALLVLGELPYYTCKYSCDNLPGNWQMPDIEDLAPVHESLIPPDTSGAANYSRTWLKQPSLSGLVLSDFDQQFYRYVQVDDDGGYTRVFATHVVSAVFNCVCSIKQLPRVEYITCNVINDASCADSLVGDGWYPMGSVSDSGTQAFWRFAQ